jgi:hypothetical protein
MIKFFLCYLQHENGKRGIPFLGGVRVATQSQGSQDFLDLGLESVARRVPLWVIAFSSEGFLEKVRFTWKKREEL